MLIVLVVYWGRKGTCYRPIYLYLYSVMCWFWCWWWWWPYWWPWLSWSWEWGRGDGTSLTRMAPATLCYSSLCYNQISGLRDSHTLRYLSPTTWVVSSLSPFNMYWILILGLSYLHIIRRRCSALDLSLDWYIPYSRPVQFGSFLEIWNQWEWKMI